MRSSIHGTFATMLLLITVGAIPALAIFGIPQFAPVVASPLHEGHDRDRERRVGESARPPVDDLFHDDTDFPARGDDSSPGPGRLGDSVPVPNRNARRDSAHSLDVIAQSPGQLPSWADDAEVDDPRSSNSQGGRSKLDRFPDIHSTPGRPGSNRSGTGMQERNGDSTPRRLLPGDRDENEKRGGRNETNEPKQPIGYQRNRTEPNERILPPNREEPARESLSWDAARRRLNELEIRNFRLEPSHRENQFVFICSYTPSDSPRVSYRFEAESEEPLKAVEKVLVQIDEWQQQRR